MYFRWDLPLNNLPGKKENRCKCNPEGDDKHHDMIITPSGSEYCHTVSTDKEGYRD